MSAATATADAGERAVPKHEGSFLGPFHHRDFSLLWSGLLVGNLGTWMQFTALGFYVASLAPNAGLGSFYIGLLGASRMVPVLIASPFAGVVADRYPRRQILFSTNVMTAIIAVLLFAVLITHTATLPVILLLNGLQGATQSFDAPARQSWVPLLVPRELISNAIGLNSFGFNAPQVIGPPLAGLIIAATGVAPCMLFNAVVKIAVVAAVVLMRPAPPSSTKRESFVTAIRDGLTFIFEHRVLRWVFLMLVVSAMTVRSYNYLLPAYAVHIVHTDARGLGWMMASTGVGAVVGALLVAAINVRRRGTIWFLSSTVAAAGVMALGFTNQLAMASLILTFVGLSTQSFIGSSNILVQTLSPDEMRGRCFSVYSMIFLGLVPGGALVMGSIARFLPLQHVFVGSGLLCIAIGAWTYFAHPRVRAS